MSKTATVLLCAMYNLQNHPCTPQLWL